MTKFKISYISDCCFVFFLSFTLFYAPFSYLLKRRLPSVITSFFAAVIALAVFVFISRKKFGALAVKKSEEEEFLRCKSAFLLSDDKTVEQTMLKLLKKTKKQAQKSNYGIILPDNERAFYKFSSRPTGADEIIKAYKSTPKGCSIIFFAVLFDDAAMAFAKNLGIRVKLVDFATLYKSLKENDCLLLMPETECPPPVKAKRKILSFFIATFDRKKAKSFAFYGLLTLLLGKFATFKIYYTVVGCLFLAFAVTLVFFAPKPQAETF